MSSTRPRPRPRPRARAPATTVTADVPHSSSPGPSSTVPSTQPAPELSVEDEDALFFRNQSRSAQAWKELSKATEGASLAYRDSTVHDISRGLMRRREESGQEAQIWELRLLRL